MQKKAKYSQNMIVFVVFPIFMLNYKKKKRKIDSIVMSKCHKKKKKTDLKESLKWIVFYSLLRVKCDPDIFSCDFPSFAMIKFLILYHKYRTTNSTFEEPHLKKEMGPHMSFTDKKCIENINKVHDPKKKLYLQTWDYRAQGNSCL